MFVHRPPSPLTESTHMYSCIKEKFARFATSEEGASAIEYGLIAGLIGALIIVAVTGIGGSVSTFFTDICTSLGGCA